jgi:hypothetical protein
MDIEQFSNESPSTSSSTSSTSTIPTTRLPMLVRTFLFIVFSF